MGVIQAQLGLLFFLLGLLEQRFQAGAVGLLGHRRLFLLLLGHLKQHPIPFQCTAHHLIDGAEHLPLPGELHFQLGRVHIHIHRPGGHFQ